MNPTSPRIVCLDGFTLNPGDLSWSGLEALGRLTVHDRTPPDQILARAEGAEIVLTNKTLLDRETIQNLKALRYIGVLATGYNVVDVEAARERGIPVMNVPAYSTRSVAQMVFAHLLNLTHHVGGHAQTVREGRWSVSPDFCYWDWPLIELDGLVMGIVGCGRIGQATARIAQAFGMKVLACRATSRPPEGSGVESVQMEELFRRSDVVSLHCPLTPATRGLVSAERLALMKKTAFLINTSRGPLVDETALAEALNGGRLAGAGLDVLSTEPPPPDHPLLRAKNCFITPHIAWATHSARSRLLEAAVENVRAFQEGRLQNVVNG